MSSSESFGVRFTGKNYATWEFQFKLFVMGKELWGHIDGSDPAPTETKDLAKWNVKDARVMSWILGSVDPLIVLNLRPYKSAKTMWEYLLKVYHQDNTARRFQLEYEIANYTQGNLSIQEYFSGFQNLWGEFSDMVYAKVPAASLSDVQAVHEQSKRDQFLMKLRHEFEITRSNLMNRDPSPSLDVCFGELLREEQRLLTQATFQQDSNPNPVAYAAYGKGKGKDMRKIQCFSCKEYGHIAANCAKKSCNYCKKHGHFIKECPIRPQNRQATAYQAAVNTSSVPVMSSASSSVGGSSVLTPEMVQQMIMSAFSALGLQGKGITSYKSWLIDSAASNHMTRTSDILCNVRPYHGSSHIQVANGSHLAINEVGDINPSFKDVYVSPGLSNSLLSVGQLVENNCDVHFSRDGCLVQDQVSGKILAKGPKVGRLFPLHFSIPSCLSFACETVNTHNEVWHKRLGHPNSVVLSHMLNSGLLGNKEHISKNLSFDCSVCKLGKSKTLSFSSHGSRAKKCFDVVHSDVWGISPVISHARYKYFVTFIDDFSRYTWVYFLRSKSEVLSVFQTFVAYVETQFSTGIKILRSDSGGEYMSHEFHDFLHHKGIVSQRSCPYTPQQNGVAERKNRHLLDVVRTLLLESSVPSKFWVEALSTAVYLINRLPSQVLNLDSPYYRLYHQHPSYLNLHTFGCVCFVHLPPHERHKLSAQSVKCAFMGYSISHKGYVCYDLCSNKCRISRNVVFFENQSFFSTHVESLPEISILPCFDELSPLTERFKPGMVYTRRQPTLPLPETDPSSETVPTTSPEIDQPSETIPASGPRRSARVSRPPDRYGFSHTSLNTTLSSTSIPTCFSEAVKYECWQKAMDEELRALQDNHTWDVVPCPSNVKAIGCKWVYSVKLRSDGTLDRYKARLVALGNRQEYGVDYEETFAPVAKMTTVRTVISVAASQGWPLHQMDVKNAFLHGDLKEDIYMTPPPGLFSSPSSAVCKLKRSLYGLKQAPRAWFEKFRSTLLRFSFVQSQYDSSLFLCKTPAGLVLLLVYVDDIVITGTDSSLIEHLKQNLQASFHMKDLGHLTYFLGLEVHTDSSGIFLNQHKYTQDLISLAGLQDSSSVDTPMEINVKFRSEEGDLLSDPTVFRQLVGSLNYLTITRPDISFAVQQVSQFMQTPRHLHLAAVRRIIRYLRGSSSRGLFFPTGSSLRLVAYSDADWAGCPDTRRSVTGWCMFLGDSLISWKSKKQARVSKSSTESEYRAMSAACSEIVWLRGLLAELGFSQSDSTSLHADNTSAIQIATNPVYHERTKHIEVDCHSIREAMDNRVISLPHVSTNLQIADIFTKAMTRQRHQFLVGKLMLLDRPASI
jgi:hypothetical protein